MKKSTRSVREIPRSKAFITVAVVVALKHGPLSRFTSMVKIYNARMYLAYVKVTLLF